MKTLLGILLATMTVFAWGESVKIQIRQASVYDQPSVLSKYLGKLGYGDEVSVLERKNGWVKIASKTNLQGWTRQQGVTSGNVALKSGSAAKDASTTEVSLAGRGFSDPVEGQYRQENPELSYATLDAMEKVSVPDDQLNAFLIEGGLHPEGGAP